MEEAQGISLNFLMDKHALGPWGASCRVALSRGSSKDDRRLGHRKAPSRWSRL